MLQTPGSNATRVIGLLYLRQTHGLLCKAQGPKGVRENWCSRVPLNFYLEIGDFCGSHQGHSALSTTAFAVPGDLLQGNWLFQCQCHLLRWERLVRVVPGKAALPLQSSSSKLSHFTVFPFLPGLPAVSCFVSRGCQRLLQVPLHQAHGFACCV